EDLDPFAVVAGDQVAGGRVHPAHGVILGAAVNQNAIALVGPSGGAGDIGADEITPDHVACGTTAGDMHPRTVVAGDEVCGAGQDAADAVVMGAGVKHHPFRVLHGAGAGGVRANLVACHTVIVGARGVKIDPIIRVSGDEVAFAEQAANGVPGRGQ